MLMESGQRHETAVASERSFGIVFASVFAIAAVYCWWQSTAFWLVLAFAVAAAVTLGLGLFFPTVLAVPNRWWAKLGHGLGLVITPIVMGLIFTVMIVPSALVMRLFGIDPMRRRAAPEAESYWVKRDQQPGSMRQQF